jgi:hypothetical protein
VGPRRHGVFNLLDRSCHADLAGVARPPPLLRGTRGGYRGRAFLPHTGAQPRSEAYPLSASRAWLTNSDRRATAVDPGTARLLLLGYKHPSPRPCPALLSLRLSPINAEQQCRYCKQDSEREREKAPAAAFGPVISPRLVPGKCSIGVACASRNRLWPFRVRLRANDVGIARRSSSAAAGPLSSVGRESHCSDRGENYSIRLTVTSPLYLPFELKYGVLGRWGALCRGGAPPWDSMAPLPAGRQDWGGRRNRNVIVA